MSYKTDDGMICVTHWMPKTDAGNLSAIAHSQGISRSEFLRRIARDLIEQYTTSGSEND